MNIRIDKLDNTPFYKQICEQIREQVRGGRLQPGQMLPSLNQLAILLGISRETTKKAYNQLLRESILISRQGKGVFVAGERTPGRDEILLILDKQSVYNQILVQAFQETLGEGAHITILLHSQNPDVLEYYLDHHLDRYDHYVVSPHFPLDKRSQARAARLLRRIPNRKLIMVDNWLQEVPGNYGVVYQDFRHDAFQALSGVKDEIIGTKGRLRVIVMPQSLYGTVILESVKEFADASGIGISVHWSVPEQWEKGDIAIVLNSQLDSGLVAIDHSIRDCKLVPGKDVRIISYNEFPLNEIVLGGLTTLSTDFPRMGESAARMILSGEPEKIHNPFRITRRKTF
ncbi:MAG: GntR family transcriptional regulator [Bacteroidales bacterium]|nr:GntR family transcriptional regulator [Bacteroidales bacterium]MBR0299065.1 GntR family transcriptional regulator [Bacteroidales bacterium]